MIQRCTQKLWNLFSTNNNITNAIWNHTCYNEDEYYTGRISCFHSHMLLEILHLMFHHFIVVLSVVISEPMLRYCFMNHTLPSRLWLILVFLSTSISATDIVNWQTLDIVMHHACRRSIFSCAVASNFPFAYLKFYVQHINAASIVAYHCRHLAYTYEW